MNKPWTAVMINESRITVVDVLAPGDTSAAKDVVQGMYSDRAVLALIPGFHADNSLSFSLDENSRLNSSSNKIDPFEQFVDPGF